MAKKKKAEKHVHQVKGTSQKKVNTLQKKSSPWIVPFILLVTFLAYIPALRAGFVNWDDGDYIVDNLIVKDFANLKLILSTPVQGNYHPLTMLSIAINYQISGLDAWSYHLFNLVFHLINCFLVYRLVMLLSNRNIIIAFTTAVLFGIHPVHVESVAWVSERKDVLYGLFFLAGLISYTKYADTGARKQYLLTIFFLVLSLLSKPAAVIFPVALFCIDLLRKRKMNIRLFVEKIPFFVLALIMGILTVIGQRAIGATGEGVYNFSMGTKILFGFYGIMMYFIKMIAPFNLSAFYAFPAINRQLDIEYYLSPLFFVILAAIFFFSLKRNRVIAFGILFYLVNLLLVMQVFLVGSAVIADRYTYIPYIGLFFIIGWLIDRYTRSTSKAFYIIVPLVLLLSIVTYNQSSVWHDTASLWDHAIKTQPSARAYDNRARLLSSEKSYDSAMDYYNKAININAADAEAYTNRGNIYFNTNKMDLAYQDYKKALSINPEYYSAWDNLGALLAMQGKYDSALINLNRALTIKPDYKPAYRNRGLTFMELKRNEEAIRDFEKFLQYQPDDADTYNTIGVCYQRLNKYQESLVPINKAIELNPNPVFYLNRSYSYYGLKNMELAKKDAITAKQGGVKIEAGYANTLGIQ
jgi:tetratricopeptide (TPR) repeat protein